MVTRSQSRVAQGRYSLHCSIVVVAVTEAASAAPRTLPLKVVPAHGRACSKRTKRALVGRCAKHCPMLVDTSDCWRRGFVDGRVDPFVGIPAATRLRSDASLRSVLEQTELAEATVAVVEVLVARWFTVVERAGVAVATASKFGRTCRAWNDGVWSSSSSAVVLVFRLLAQSRLVERR